MCSSGMAVCIAALNCNGCLAGEQSMQCLLDLLAAFPFSPVLTSSFESLQLVLGMPGGILCPEGKRSLSCLTPVFRNEQCAVCPTISCLMQSVWAADDKVSGAAFGPWTDVESVALCTLHPIVSNGCCSTHQPHQPSKEAVIESCKAL